MHKVTFVLSENFVLAAVLSFPVLFCNLWFSSFLFSFTSSQLFSNSYRVSFIHTSPWKFSPVHRISCWFWKAQKSCLAFWISKNARDYCSAWSWRDQGRKFSRVVAQTRWWIFKIKDHVQTDFSGSKALPPWFEAKEETKPHWRSYIYNGS